MLQHFDKIGVAKKARQTGSHTVANRIHSVILQKFTSSIEGSASTSQHVWPVIQEDTISDKNSTDDEDIFEDDGSSVDSESNDSITASCTSSGIPDQEHSRQVDGGNQMMVDEPQQSHHSMSAFVAEESNGTFPSLWSLDPKLTKKQCVIFRGWAFYLKQRT